MSSSLGHEDRDLARAQNNGDLTWTEEQMAAEFELLGTSAPFAVVRRRSDSRLCTLEFAGNPRVYFDLREDGAL